MARTLMLLFAAITALAVATSALGSPPAAPSLHVQPTSVKAGGVVHVWGTAGSCSAGSKLLVISGAFPEYTFGVGALVGKVRSDHTFSLRHKIRGNATTGTYAVSVKCAGVDLGVSATIRVK